MTIIQLISSEGHYGAENVMVNLAEALSVEGCNAVVAVFRDSRRPHMEVAEQASRRGLPVEILPCRGRLDWKAVAKLRLLIQWHKADILHSHGYKSDLYAYAAAWPKRFALMATSHNWPDPSRTMQFYAKLDRLALRRFDGIAVVSRNVAEVLKASGVPARRITSIHNGVAVDRFRRAAPTLRRTLGWERDSVVGFIGRQAPEKGGDVLLRAAQNVCARRPQARFVLVGDGPSRSAWEQLASELGIGPKVSFAGVRDDMPEVFSSIDMLVVPSLNEGMPMCVIEAMAAGKPVIATAVGAIPTLVTAGMTGLLVCPGNAGILSQAILGLMDDPHLARRLGEAGYARAAGHFSSAAMARSYLRMYEQGIANRLASARGQRSWQFSR